MGILYDRVARLLSIGLWILLAVPPVQSFCSGEASASALPLYLPMSTAGVLPGRYLTKQQRIAYQCAIERVYWRHRIWPKENQRPKPTLNELVPPVKLDLKVEEYLHKSSLLEASWRRPIMKQDLEAEMRRMANHTKRPDILRELWSALDNDPFVIAECLARPLLVNRLVSNKGGHSDGSGNSL